LNESDRRPVIDAYQSVGVGPRERVVVALQDDDYSDRHTDQTGSQGGKVGLESGTCERGRDWAGAERGCGGACV